MSKSPTHSITVYVRLHYHEGVCMTRALSYTFRYVTTNWRAHFYWLNVYQRVYRSFFPSTFHFYFRFYDMLTTPCESHAAYILARI